MSAASFDPLARPYRWLEYGAFGPALDRCRRAALPWARGTGRALVLGDGDGRFTAALLGAERELSVDSIDLSPAMLRLAQKRTREDAGRVRFFRAEAGALDRVLPAGACYDLVATHFFLDCLSTREVAELAERVRGRMRPGARWLVSEFRAASAPAKALVRLLYLFFRVAAGLKVQQLPEYEGALTAAGFVCIHREIRLGGLLLSSCWQLAGKQPGSRPPTPTSMHLHALSNQTIHLDTVPAIDPDPYPEPGIGPDGTPEPDPDPTIPPVSPEPGIDPGFPVNPFPSPSPLVTRQQEHRLLQ